jgi:hypothetical protein
MEITTQNTKPSDFHTEKSFVGMLGKYEKEIIGRNIIMISQRNNDSWDGFTFAEYEERCLHVVGDGEKDILDLMVKDGLLHLSDGRYSVTNYFLFRVQDNLKAPLSV